MHKILDPNLEAQITGRIQRAGKKYKSNIHYVLYEEEECYLHT